MENIKKNKSLTGVIILMLIVILVLVGYIAYDKLLKEKNNVTLIGIVETAYEGSVVDYVSKDIENKDEYTDNRLTKSVKIPKITLNTANAKKFNEKIYSNYSDRINYVKMGKHEVSSEIGWDRIEYFSSIYDGVIYIVVEHSGGLVHGGSGTFYTGYYYDIALDKEITSQEVYKRAGITSDDILERECLQYGMEQCVKFHEGLDYLTLPVRRDGIDKYYLYINNDDGMLEVTYYK